MVPTKAPPAIDDSQLHTWLVARYPTIMGQTLAGLEPESQVDSIQNITPKIGPLNLAPMRL